MDSGYLLAPYPNQFRQLLFSFATRLKYSTLYFWPTTLATVLGLPMGKIETPHRHIYFYFFACKQRRTWLNKETSHQVFLFLSNSKLRLRNL